MIKFSIIVPVYNTEKTLKRCLDSIINQTNKNFELIVVNDCSLDGSIIILQGYQNNFSNVKVISHKENRGSLYARLTGLANATGDYFLFVDSDDELNVNTCQVISKYVLNHGGFDVLHFSTKVVSDDHTTSDFYQDFTKPLGIGLHGESIASNFFMKGNIESFLWNKCYNNSVLRGISNLNLPFGITMAEDYFFTAYIMLNAKSYCCIPDNLYKYYYGNGVSGVKPITDTNHWKNIVRSTFLVLYHVQSLLINSGKYGIYRKGFLRELNRRISWLLGDIKMRCVSQIRCEAKEILISENTYYKKQLNELI